jgi:hypothetical protein
LKAKAKITIIVDCYDDHNEKVLEESHESIYVFDTWQQAQATYDLSKSLIQDRQAREKNGLKKKPTFKAEIAYVVSDE